MKRARRWPVMVVAAAAAGLLGATRASADPSSQPRVRRAVRARPATPGWHEDQRLVVTGVERWFRYYVPVAMSGRPAVVVLLHGGTQSMRKIFRTNAGGTQAWQEMANEAGFLLLVPNGLNADTDDPAGDYQNWNDCRTNLAVGDTHADDVGFIAAMLDWADTVIGIDRERVYATGASNGGGMSYRLAIDRPDLVAAVAVFIMNLAAEDECGPPSRPVPVFICNGTDDPLVPWDGGAVAGGSRGTVRSTGDTLAAWLAANRAGPEPAEVEEVQDLDPTDGCTVRRERYAPLGEGAEVELLTVAGGGHTMPSIAFPVPRWILALFGFGNQSRDLEGAREAWKFLSRQSLDGAE